MTDWPAIHAKAVEEFRRGWDRPDPHAWDAFFDDSMRFTRPLLCDGVGPVTGRRRLMRPWNVNTSEPIHLEHSS